MKYDMHSYGKNAIIRHRNFIAIATAHITSLSGLGDHREVEARPSQVF